MKMKTCKKCGEEKKDIKLVDGTIIKEVCRECDIEERGICRVCGLLLWDVKKKKQVCPLCDIYSIGSEINPYINRGENENM